MFLHFTRCSLFSPLQSQYALINTTDLLLYVMHTHGSCISHLRLSIFAWTSSLIGSCVFVMGPTSFCWGSVVRPTTHPAYVAATISSYPDALTQPPQTEVILSLMAWKQKSPASTHGQDTPHMPGTITTTMTRVCFYRFSTCILKDTLLQMVKHVQTTSKDEVPVIVLDRQKAKVNSFLLVVDAFGSNC